MTSRRSFLIGAAAALVGIAAPAVIRTPGLLMPIAVPNPPAPSVMQLMDAIIAARQNLMLSIIDDSILYGAYFTREAPDTLLGIERVDPREIVFPAYARA